MSTQTETNDTFPKLLRYNARVRAERPAMREKDLGIWQSWSWAEVYEEVSDYAAGLYALGLRAGDKIAIIGDNRPRLYWTLTAAQVIGAVPVPTYADSVAEEIQFVLDHAEAKFAMAEDQEQVDKLIDQKDHLPGLEVILFDDSRGLRDYNQSFLWNYEAVLEKGREFRTQNPEFIERCIDGRTGSDVCIMLYTSGTTGQPKGVVHTHDSVLITARNAAELEGLNERDEVLAYLPMAWVGDNIFSFGQSYAAGFCVSCPESSDTVLNDLWELGPTYYFAPPRIFENLLTTVMIRMEDAGKLKQRMFHYFMDHAKKVGVDILDGRSVGLMDRIKYGLGELLVYGPLKNALGLSRVRLGYTAGEAIGPEIFEFYRSIGINLKQLYGSTEAAVFITIQPNGGIKPDTVGVPAPDVEIKLSDRGEVLFTGPGVFKEYYKNPESTADTKTDDNWVMTGDAGFFDDEGQLKIIDRAKDVGQLNDGTLFAPKYIENKLKFFPNIKEVVAFGHERDYCAAFINIDLEAVGNWAERNGIAYASYQELASLPQVYEQIQAHVEETNRQLSTEERVAGSQIKRFLLLHKMLDADDGELTRTSKVRRRYIAEKYDVLIEALYSDKKNCRIETEVTYEDGRKGKLAADLEIRDAKTVAIGAGAAAQAAE
ncbi:AMP-dependent synthetase/ligase [Aestuariispira insulae]|uniref:Long-chain acyl-CoA synthetase n=1 Tax=Aestuariispira insulae TaxID=1461337 RepID=A0A3D9HRP1_9PROT|nr:AMP-binding protein [Aestuariispira insulae]RED51536.1 long-chain acyl-CoA synthetase [Aestuariispira insulae]